MADETSSGDVPSRGKLLRDVIAFVAKLWLEGFKDVVLMPLSIVAALIDFVFRWATGGKALYAVMQLGERFEQWVNLYGALDDRKDLSHTIQNTVDYALGSYTGAARVESPDEASSSAVPEEKNRN